ncbi:hypothetical protein OG936_30100 [Streptomyces sp. NBC_00846]|uniref:hypothetical protein n=1 Tax=Streptomyces sp. NBC_00846 TaxID=2975849 RepID=UPI003863FDAA|nr:hypothetical protein OG936_30100 [Streptomyces sp. NBC_00846]
MRYAATLASTAEREFLALAKIGRDGREIGMDRRDMLDLVQFDRRTHRILPNGYRLLPPTRSCDKGNACHGCDHFATDRTFLPDVQRQLVERQALVATRQARHAERYGEPMSEANVWLEQHIAEIRSVQPEITALEAQPSDSPAAVRGAPIEALRSAARPVSRPHLRPIAGAGLLALSISMLASLAACAKDASEENLRSATLGCGLLMIALITLAPFLAPSAIRLTGRLTRRFGITGHLAQRNASGKFRASTRGPASSRPSRPRCLASPGRAVSERLQSGHRWGDGGEDATHEAPVP